MNAKTVLTVAALAFSQITAGAAVYAAIRADLREALVSINAHEKHIDRIDATVAQHETRIDHLEARK